MGDACRFSHASEGPAEGATGFGHLRRPLIQAVVLYATDQRVMAYSRSVAQKFIDAGAEVFLNVRFCGGLGLFLPCAAVLRFCSWW